MKQRIEGIKCIVAILTAPFRGGSVGAAEGAKLISAIDKARRKRYPLIIYSHGTAGIRIQEGTHGVIQMPPRNHCHRRYMRAGGTLSRPLRYQTVSADRLQVSWAAPTINSQCVLPTSALPGLLLLKTLPAWMFPPITIIAIKPFHAGISKVFGIGATPVRT